MKKSKGSAILIAVLLVAAVGSTAFGIGRLFLMDASVADKYESAVIAYYAAESGIEEGLLRYRYDKNQEVLADSTSSVPIVNLTDNSYQSHNPSSYSFNPLKRYYLPSVEYLSDFYGEDVDGASGLSESDLGSGDYPDVYRIPKDESIKLDLSKLNTSNFQDITLYVRYINMGTDTKFSFDSCNNSNRCPFVEVALTGSTPTSPDKYQSKIALTAIGHDNSFSEAGYIEKSADSVNGVITYGNLIAGIRSKNSDPIFDPSSPLNISLKPLYADAIIGIRAEGITPGAKILPAPYNTIKSTGHYGGVTRTLEAKIDRQAGTVFDLFDFVLYQEQ